jgi:hypothetical protein
MEGSATYAGRLEIVRAAAGFQEMPVIVREIFNFDRHIYLVKFSDGATTFVFPDEVDVGK